MVLCPNGQGAVCKTAYAGSNPVGASSNVWHMHGCRSVPGAPTSPGLCYYSGANAKLGAICHLASEVILVRTRPWYG